MSAGAYQDLFKVVSRFGSELGIRGTCITYFI